MIREAQPSTWQPQPGSPPACGPSTRPADLEPEFSELIEGDEAAVFLLFGDDCHDEGDACGFAQCQLRRDYVEGTSSSPVGYLEGIYVDEARRHRGHAPRAAARLRSVGEGARLHRIRQRLRVGQRGQPGVHLHAGSRKRTASSCFAKRL